MIAEKLDVLPVEPNIQSFPEFEVVEYHEALDKADIVVFLVSHKEFQGIEVESDKEVLTFCKLDVKQKEAVV
ncbi:UDP-N-acetyl-D-mannosamine dehydrogenase [compost metagenome]